MSEEQSNHHRHTFLDKVKAHADKEEQRNDKNHYPENIMTSGSAGARPTDEVSRGVTWDKKDESPH
ncbi:uncharacterized protein N7469_009066 [Penicillium citrinum]|uniref:Uncharacterized protein n=2 Tax=Penicillium TaxID=5073 RepID=A0A9W9NMN0_PENCI|nr:uncharacterized protein N7469_009066 [Penicillium citrinum]KAJ5222826.1 hypothetical protein N7469_009066 [Penicillium citrinum]KAJ5580987.1 hypothetical protein N7450_007288 [Penicillium hetheringtonii]